ncbi:protein misato isoform X1 [Metopolophium dirhodum]|uniref:protein misato isoform X1 n=2 Tax=Metopolophium dirhodum TaxID=44670 RepID=UPI0029904E2B|nr:protein misato isoform X1 [Metopolophium dirhodum]
MNSTREIITLQFGHYSNFIGTHFWNLQEASFTYEENNKPLEICHDVLYREGVNLKGEVTYTPRMLCVDLKNSFYQLPDVHRGLYDLNCSNIDEEILNSSTKIQTIQEEKIPSNEFFSDLAKQELLIDDDSEKINIAEKVYNLDDDVKIWSDFLKARFHPRTITSIDEYKHNDSSNVFNNFAQGLGLWDSYKMKETWTDNLRLYAEECDYLQGFHISMDSLNGFGGLACKALEYLKDEYSNKTIIAMPVLSDNYILEDENSELQAVNTSLLFSSLFEHSTMFVPLTTSSGGWIKSQSHLNLDYLSYKNNLDYHSSAILASAIDTFTLGYRNRFGNDSMQNMCTRLTPLGRKAVSASIQLPLGFESKSNLLDYLQNSNLPLWKPISPQCTTEMSVTQTIVLRGITENMLYSNNLIKDSKNPSHHCTSPSDLLKLFLSFCDHVRMTEVHSFDSSLETIAPFPNIFSQSINQHGFVESSSRSSTSVVAKCAAISGLHNSNSMRDMFISLKNDSSKVKGSKLSHMFNYEIDVMDYKETLENLLVLSDNYLINDCL